MATVRSLSPIPDEFPDPDCPKCGGDGIPQSRLHAIIGDEASNMACPYCWPDEAQEQEQ